MQNNAKHRKSCKFTEFVQLIRCGFLVAKVWFHQCRFLKCFCFKIWSRSVLTVLARELVPTFQTFVWSSCYMLSCSCVGKQASQPAISNDNLGIAPSELTLQFGGRLARRETTNLPV